MNRAIPPRSHTSSWRGVLLIKHGDITTLPFLPTRKGSLKFLREEEAGLLCAT
jgi:hypothetical protein